MGKSDFWLDITIHDHALDHLVCLYILTSATGYQAKTQHLQHITSRGHTSTSIYIYANKYRDLCTNPIYCWCMSKVCQHFLARFPLDDICCCKSADKCSTRPSETRHLLLSSDPQPWPGSLTVDSICFENINIKTIQKPKYQQVRYQLQLPIPWFKLNNKTL